MNYLIHLIDHSLKYGAQWISASEYQPGIILAGTILLMILIYWIMSEMDRQTDVLMKKYPTFSSIFMRTLGVALLIWVCANWRFLQF